VKRLLYEWLDIIQILEMFILSRIEYFAEVSSMDLASIIKGRRSIRDFQDKEIPEEHLLAILEAGIWAPSGSNIQPWEFVLVNDSILIKKIKLLSPGVVRYAEDIDNTMHEQKEVWESWKAGAKLSNHGHLDGCSKHDVNGLLTRDRVLSNSILQ
jgi:hypothetical protein